MTFEKVSDQNYTHGHAKAELYRHTTGLLHMHVDNGSVEKTFAIGFGTFPEDSKGTPHILEHMALCGSKKYPVKDPFFSMLPRSVATFMNAFTAGDFTVYPFATPEISDFNNLMDVYLDAVFSPLLTEQDFKQEGWRYQLNASGQVEIQGVVYNEMKDAVIAKSRVLHKSIETALFPRTIYAVESGGDPQAIPSLTHAELKEFHRTHYHPSKGILVTTGDLNVSELHAKLNQYLADMTITEIQDHHPPVEYQAQPNDLAFVEFPLPASPEDQHNTYGLAFRLPEANSVLDELTVMMLNDVVFSESGNFGSLFAENSDVKVRTSIQSNVPNAAAIFYATAPNSNILEEMKLGIQHIQNIPIEKETLAIALREQIIQAHDKTQNHYGAAGIDISLEIIGKGLHQKNMFEQVSLLDVLMEHEQTLLDPNHYQKWLQKNLNLNTISLTFVGKNDPSYVQNIKAQEKSLLDQLNTDMSSADKERIRSENTTLIEHQNTPKNSNLLPIFDIQNIPTQPPRPPVIHSIEDGLIPIRHIDTLPGPSSLSEINLMIDLSHLQGEDYRKASFAYSQLGNFGIGPYNWQDADLYVQETSPNLSSELKYYDIKGQEARSKRYLRFNIAGIDQDLPNLLEGLERLINDTQFTDEQRMSYLNQQTQIGTMQQFNNLAKKAAGALHQARVNPHERLKQFEGGILNLKQSYDRVCRNDVKQDLRDLQEGLKLIQNAPKFIQTYGAEGAKKAGLALSQLLQHRELQSAQDFKHLASIPVEKHDTNPYLVCVGDYAGNTVTASWLFETKPTDSDYVASIVLATYLKNFYVHQAVREKGGAYTSSCGYDGYAFTMLSQRDPRHVDTLKDFEQAYRHLQQHGIQQEDFEMAKLSVAKIFLHDLHGNQIANGTFKRDLLSEEDHPQKIRSNLLNLTPDDVMRVAHRILSVPPYAITIGTTPAEADKILQSRPDFNKVDFVSQWTRPDASRKVTP